MLDIASLLYAILSGTLSFWVWHLLLWVLYGTCLIRVGCWIWADFLNAPSICFFDSILVGQRLVEWWFKQYQGQAQAKLAWLRTRYSSKLNELKSKVPSDHPILELYQTSSQRPGHHALICTYCFAYNGLASHPQSTRKISFPIKWSIEQWQLTWCKWIEYVCPKCFKFNTIHHTDDMVKEEGSIASRVKRRHFKSRWSS